MNNDIPTIWLVISGIFFFLGIILFAAATFVLFKVVQLMEEVKPKIDSLTVKVETLIFKVDRVADRVEETMESVKTSVDGFGTRATGIMGSVETIAKTASGKFERFTPLITGATIAYRIFTAMRARREHQKSLPAKR